MTVSFSENEDCNINGKQDPKLSGYKQTSNNIANIITYDSLMYDKELGELLNYKPFRRNLNKTETIASNYTILTNFSNAYTGYIETIEEYVPCNFYDNLNSDLYYIVIAIVVIFVISTLCVLIIYCKYRGVKNDYHRLKEENDTTAQLPTDRYGGSSQLPQASEGNTNSDDKNVVPKKSKI